VVIALIYGHQLNIELFNTLGKKEFSSFSKTRRGCCAGTYLQPLGVLQRLQEPLKVFQA
jgi:hypothetical protein